MTFLNAVLREDNTVAFDVLVGWVYTNRLPPDGSFWNPVEVYILADKICLTELMDEVMDAIQTDFPLSSPDALVIYSRLPKDSKLRLFALDIITFEFNTFRQLNLPILADVNAKNEDFALDFLIRIQSYMSRRTVIPNPRKSYPCTYHCHEDGKCTSTRNPKFSDVKFFLQGNV
ncbi:uncharacterized protein EAE98_004295 [Botrytis deweyae]|uniref:BTB domain-containing protein n=1 Tax=Botrytis deweyae TaxID=2478750 RepID=A0ABQ7IQG5_9HELO|nr:uncharacterized protein EAE98_004295 [Botrytis deweyae]KAF7931559.1 hypothetical protein EAE98_004295 [Botrytis deweyae]